jgi:curved DNA-binding protein CbpA
VARTHYDVLGVRASATPEEVRRAYYDRARVLHPDRAGDQRAMQDVNEAWRVLRDPGTRAEYDRSLRRPAPDAPRADTRVVGAHDLDDRPVPRAPAEPGDMGVFVVRSLPWVAVLVVLGIIFVFTAFARTGDGSTGDLIDKCIATEAGMPIEVPCDEPNEGRVSLIVERQSRCPTGTTARAIAGGQWYCLRPAGSP